MKSIETIKHLIAFITTKGHREEANKYIEEIEAGNAPPEAEGDALSKLLSSRAQPKTKYSSYVPGILEAKKKPMLVTEILKAYKEKASEDGVAAAASVTEALLKAYLNGTAAKTKGVVKVKDFDNTYTFKKPVAA